MSKILELKKKLIIEMMGMECIKQAELQYGGPMPDEVAEAFRQAGEAAAREILEAGGPEAENLLACFDTIQ